MTLTQMWTPQIAFMIPNCREHPGTVAWRRVWLVLCSRVATWHRQSHGLAMPCPRLPEMVSWSKAVVFPETFDSRPTQTAITHCMAASTECASSFVASPIWCFLGPRRVHVPDAYIHWNSMGARFQSRSEHDQTALLLPLTRQSRWQDNRAYIKFEREEDETLKWVKQFNKFGQICTLRVMLFPMLRSWNLTTFRRSTTSESSNGDWVSRCFNSPFELKHCLYLLVSCQPHAS